MPRDIWTHKPRVWCCCCRISYLSERFNKTPALSLLFGREYLDAVKDPSSFTHHPLPCHHSRNKSPWWETNKSKPPQLLKENQNWAEPSNDLVWEAIHSLPQTSCLDGNGCSDRSLPPSPTGSPIFRVFLLADACGLSPFTSCRLLEETQHLGDSPLILEDRVMFLLVPLGLSLLSPVYSSRRLVYIPKLQATQSYAA